ncbi:mannose-1-phosphate guanylyltransferase/mannose-6-phosphate isomerase [Microvirga rosea]|uniref:mannose-1-phosphate guanylyltransferase/mannose-6-phosphate isomerase n=1 Tax=Microvirga rosea TaxID=2715425 RepID=UPI001D0A5501|nr:mannose-1-phosphate guanylyltransferase/mannose-6-phosphate isomerase [Microvirga rosea]MCB8823035.1 mannose-1-phosphate guanylyltransferase/mannose-6-phosphate isomerase [Microvirga rosea]
MTKIVPVLLSGGSGSRLWPLSSQAHPKQLLTLGGETTLLQQAAMRLKDDTLFEAPIIVANAAHGMAIGEQLRAVGFDAPCIILEPVGRNTAPAVLVSALVAEQRSSSDLMLVMPTDHVITDGDVFGEVIRKGCAAALKGDFVLFGIEPSAPETGFGYIQADLPIGPETGARMVKSFTEKPDRTTAERFLASGEYLWNSGIFLLPIHALIRELEQREPDMVQACRKAVSEAVSCPEGLHLDHQAFSHAKSISLDHALFERVKNIAVIPSPLEWHDIGTWSALWEIGAKDSEQNVVLGSAILKNSKASYVRSEGPIVAAIGVQDLIIVVTSEAVLVVEKSRSQDVKLLAEEIARMKERR